MNPLPRSSLILLAVLPACIGNAFLGLIPLGASLDGTVEDGIYTSPDGTFRVAQPFAADDYETSYMQAKERFDTNQTYVSFGPAAFDQTIYRLEVARRSSPDQVVDLDQALAVLVRDYRAQLEDGYRALLEVEISAGEDTISGRPARYAQFVQDARGLSNAGSDRLVHDVWIVDFASGVAAVWVQSMPDGPDRRGILPRAFAESVVLE